MIKTILKVKNKSFEFNSWLDCQRYVKKHYKPKDDITILSIDTTYKRVIDTWKSNTIFDR